MDGISKEAEISIAASSMFPGFRFSPTDEELILYYLRKKVEGYDKCVEVIPEVDICKFEPWDLPAKAIIKSDQEWFFFSPRGKKYPNGSQSKRATEIGYWKATGKERAVKSGLNLIGTKRTLVFHIGRAPRGERTEWIMHEYCMSGQGQDALVVCRLRRKCDYHAIDGSNDFKPVSMMNNSGNYSGGSLNHVASNGDKMAECSMKKSSSSHESYSVEQNESACESNQKLREEIMQPESSSQERCANDEEDDLFADILNDNIIQLDESPPTSAPEVQHAITTSTTVSIVPRAYTRPSQHVVSRMYPSQGTANRRIRLRKLRRLSGNKEAFKECVGENTVSPKSKQSMMGLRKNCNQVYVVVIVMTLVVLFLSVGVSWYATTSPIR